MRTDVAFYFLLIGAALAELPEVPDLDDFEVVKERCDKKGGPDAYPKLKVARDETIKCIKSLIDVDTVGNELEEAKKTGSMDEVFGKYCNKRPDLKACVKKTYDAAEICLEQNERDAMNTTGNILDQIGEFVCRNDGERIAMFVAEGGVECIKSRTDQIRNCFNQTLKFNPTTFSTNDVPNLALDKKKCDDIKTIQDCVVKDLEEHCEDTTPANFVDAMFRFVKKLACKNIKKRSVSLKRHIRNAVRTIPDQIRSEFETKITEICNKNGDEESYERLMAAVNASRYCLNSHKTLGTPLTPLTAHQAVMDNCTRSARKALEHCLSESEKYYPDFILRLIQNLIGFLHRHADKLRASPSNMEFAQCLKSISEQESQKEMLQCYNKSKGDGDVIPPKSELCRKQKEAILCIKAVFDRRCVQDIKIGTFMEDLVTTLEEPCLPKEEVTI